MGSEPGYTLEVRHPRDAACLWALQQYYGELNERFSAQDGFDVARSADPEEGALVEPRGAFFLALPGHEGRLDLGQQQKQPGWTGDGPGPLGCVALKGAGAGRRGATAEVKRLWVSPLARKLGVGRALMRAVEAKARALGITTLRLDTNSALPEAIAFYQRLGGWRPIPRFNDDPYPDLFFEKTLAPDTAAEAEAAAQAEQR